MSNKLMLHCGGKPVAFEDLDHIPVPEETSTYKPISHYDLARQVKTVGQDLLKGFSLYSESYGIARDGNQMFAIQTYRNGSEELGLSIGFRNSLDKSMIVGFAFGSSVFVCDNLALRGDITYMRKHTGAVIKELHEKLIVVCYQSVKQHNEIQLFSEEMKAIPFSDREAFSVMGQLYGSEVISPRQLTTVKSEWLKPSHEAFQPRTAWSLYNAFTEALKTSPPACVIENHLSLSDYFGEVVELAKQ